MSNGDLDTLSDAESREDDALDLVNDALAVIGADGAPEAPDPLDFGIDSDIEGNGGIDGGEAAEEGGLELDLGEVDQLQADLGEPDEFEADLGEGDRLQADLGDADELHPNLGDEDLLEPEIQNEDENEDVESSSTDSSMLDPLEEKITSVRNGDNQDISTVSQFTSILARMGIDGPRHLRAFNAKQRAIKIGSGGQFTVFREESEGLTWNDEKLVIKRLNVPFSRDGNKAFASGKEYREQLRGIELEVLSLCNPLLRNHRNIVTLVAWGYDYPMPDTPVPALFVEAAMTTLAEFLKPDFESQWPADPTDIKYQLILDVTSGIQALHRLGIVHGDVKPDNVLVFKETRNRNVPFVAKLSDFGVCIDMENFNGREIRIEEYRGTTGWVPPETRGARWTWAPFTPECLLRMDSYSMGLVILSVLTNRGQPVQVQKWRKTVADIAVEMLQKVESIPSAITAQVTKALKSLLAQNPWDRSLPNPELLETNTPAYKNWRSVCETTQKKLLFNGIIDPTYNKGPFYWYRLDEDLLKELEQQYAESKSDSDISFAGDVLFGMAQTVTGKAPSYLDRMLEYVTESARRGHSPARAVYAQIINAHKMESQFSDVTLDKWLLRSISEGYLFARCPPRIGEEQIEAAREEFRNTGGYCQDPFRRKKDIIDLVKDKKRVRTWYNDTKTVKVADNHGNTLLHVAAALGQVDTVRLLVEEAKVNPNIVNDNSETPLYKACQAGQVEVINYLLDRDVDCSICSRDKVTPLHWLFVIPESDVRHIATRLVKEGGSSVNAVMVPRMGDKGFIQKIFTVHYPFELPMGTPFHWAAFSRNITAMEALLELGANIDAQYHESDEGTTPLALAVWHGDVNVVRFLLQKGADGKAKDRKARNLLHLLTYYLPERHGSLKQAWHYWIRHGNWDEHLKAMTEIVELLVKGGAELEDRDAVFPKSTPIILASAPGEWNPGAVCGLLTAGADVNEARGASGNTVLHTLAEISGDRMNYPDSYLYVFEQICKHMNNVDLRNLYDEDTPLNLVSTIQRSEGEFHQACQFLLSHSPPADVNKADRQGMTPVYSSLVSEQNPEWRAFYLIGKGATLLGMTDQGRDVFFAVVYNKSLNDQQSYDLILRLLRTFSSDSDKTNEDDFEHLRATYQKHFLQPNPQARQTLWFSASAGRLRTTRLLLELYGDLLNEQINMLSKGQPRLTLLDSTIHSAERSRHEHIKALASYSIPAAKARVLNDPESLIYDQTQGGPARAKEAYENFPSILRELRSRGAKRACEVMLSSTTSPAKNKKEEVSLCGLLGNESYGDLWDISELYSVYPGLHPSKQPHLQEWAIVYEITRVELPQFSWRSEIVEFLRVAYEDGQWKPEKEFLEDNLRALKSLHVQSGESVVAISSEFQVPERQLMRDVLDMIIEVNLNRQRTETSGVTESIKQAIKAFLPFGGLVDSSTATRISSGETILGKGSNESDNSQSDSSQTVYVEINTKYKLEGNKGTAKDISHFSTTSVPASGIKDTSEEEITEIAIQLDTNGIPLEFGKVRRRSRKKITGRQPLVRTEGRQ